MRRTTTVVLSSCGLAQRCLPALSAIATYGAGCSPPCPLSVHCGRRFASSTATATADGAETASTPAGEVASSSQASSAASSPLQQLYKSSHRGSGTVPMPKPSSEPRLGARKAPRAILSARSSCAEDMGPVPSRALSPLQKRQLLYQNKAAFVLTPQALRRVKYLLSQYTHKPTTTTSSSSSTSSKSNGKTSETGASVEEAGQPTDSPTGIRIGVRRRGCSGYSYTVNYFFPAPETAAEGTATKAKPSAMNDVVVEQDGVKVVVEADALFYVIGTEMDYVVRNVEEKFTFKNPNQKYSCGCEESFMPFDEDDLDDD